MLTLLYIEALFVDGELADQVWDAWSAGHLDELSAWLAWWLIVVPDLISKPYDNK